jgi:polyhydroxyalkanoate synthesis repressor PhaR
MSESIDKRVIKKYPNRRLYDTAESKYVTLSDVRELVLGGVAFCVIDKKSGDDITRSILLQIIIEQEEEENVDPMFSTEVLEQMIGFYGKSVQGQAGDFIQNSLSLFQEQQKRFQEQVTGALQNNPMSLGLPKSHSAIWICGSKCKTRFLALLVSGGRDKVAPTTNNGLLSAGFEKRGRPFLSRSLRFGDLAFDSLYLPEYLTRYALTKTTEILFNRFYFRTPDIRIDGEQRIDHFLIEVETTQI